MRFPSILGQSQGQAVSRVLEDVGGEVKRYSVYECMFPEKALPFLPIARFIEPSVPLTTTEWEKTGEYTEEELNKKWPNWRTRKFGGRVKIIEEE